MLKLLLKIQPFRLQWTRWKLTQLRKVHSKNVNCRHKPLLNVPTLKFYDFRTRSNSNFYDILRMLVRRCRIRYFNRCGNWSGNINLFQRQADNIYRIQKCKYITVIDKHLIKRFTIVLLKICRKSFFFAAGSYVKLHPRASQRRTAISSGGLLEDIPVRELS